MVYRASGGALKRDAEPLHSSTGSGSRDHALSVVVGRRAVTGEQLPYELELRQFSIGDVVNT